MTELPNGWRRTTLGDECEIVSGSTPKTSEPSFWDGNIPWLTPADLSKWKGTYIDGGARYITQAGLDSCSARLFPKNTVMMSSRAPIGYTAIANTEMCTNQGFKSMLPSPSVHPAWLRYFLEHALPEIKAMSSGTTFAEISGKKLGTLPMNLPPIEEQKSIVEALDDHLSKLDKALVELNGGLIASEVFTRSLLKAAFDGRLTNSEKNDWKTTPIGEVVDFAPTKPNHLKASQDVCSFIPMAAVQEVTGIIDLSQTISHEKALSKTLTFFNEGDVLFAKVTPCMENGKVAVARGLTNQMGYGSTEFHILSPRPQLLADYLRYFLVSKDFRVNAASAMTGAVGLRRVPKSYLEEHYIPLPSLDDQRQVVDVLDFQLSIVDQLKESIHGHISRISTLRKSLLHSAFTGKLLVEGKSE